MSHLGTVCQQIIKNIRKKSMEKITNIKMRMMKKLTRNKLYNVKPQDN